MLCVNKQEEMIELKMYPLTAFVEMRLTKELNIFYEASRLNIYGFCNY